MSFLTAIPEELLAAAAQLEGIGNSLTAQNAGVAAPTTAIAPAAADQVSALQAGIFSAYGGLYQQIAAEAQAMQQQFVSTLGMSSGTYSQTEAANVAATTPAENFINGITSLFGGPLGSTNGEPLSLSGNLANEMNIGGGNWASAASNLLGMTGGGLLPPAEDAAAVAGNAAEAADAVGMTAPAGAGMAAVPMSGMGQASLVGKLSVPPSWAGTPGATPATAVQTVGWTATAPQAGPGTVVPGMPGLGAAARNSAGFGAPRYGVKPIVMPKPAAV
jgi:hypothetical protein